MMDRFIMEIAYNAIASNLQCNHKPRARARSNIQTLMTDTHSGEEKSKEFSIFFLS